jgi:hypothetical protein
MKVWEVYNILTHLLNIKPSENNGTLSEYLDIFKKNDDVHLYYFDFFYFIIFKIISLFY